MVKSPDDEYMEGLEAEIERLRKQRDELLAALGDGSRHPNDDTPHSELCEAIIDSKEADVGQGLHPYWKWAFRRGFHEAECSYKVDVATVEKQRDELLSKLDKLEGRATLAEVQRDEHVEEIKLLKHQIDELLSKKFTRFANEECWIYQGDGEDHLESLVCPVVISASQLLQIEKQRDELLAALDVVREAVTRAHFGCANVASGAYCNEARQLARASLINLDTALSAIAGVKGAE